ncbi:hypothetical protein [Natronoglycomyces albus]|uniref:Uncharacterized protein n=1 Tax=Natronoglycomyces albus TaxID=2811108 RepID=A0A895XGR7_9ACTN|nr:hypothetical protein [Natronoglycomyces albus]QSB04087.1 hypothetical protein JQS30_09675 [Natronoglycomyces albus]
MTAGDRSFDPDAAIDFSNDLKQAASDLDATSMTNLHSGVLSFMPAFGVPEIAQVNEQKYESAYRTVVTDMQTLLDNLSALADSIDEAVAAEAEAEEANTVELTNFSAALE